MFGHDGPISWSGGVCEGKPQISHSAVTVEYQEFIVQRTRNKLYAMDWMDWEMGVICRHWNPEDKTSKWNTDLGEVVIKYNRLVGGNRRRLEAAYEEEVGVLDLISLCS